MLVDHAEFIWFLSKQKLSLVKLWFCFGLKMGIVVLISFMQVKSVLIPLGFIGWWKGIWFLTIWRILRNKLFLFLKKLYDNSDAVSMDFWEDLTAYHIPRVVFKVDNIVLVRCHSNEEIKKSVFALNSDSAPYWCL